jgi:hypothetical protein
VADDGRSLWDRAKDALGMGGDDEHDHEHGEHQHAEHQHRDFEPDDHEPRRDDGELGVDGATQGAASAGAGGAMGATGAMGGAGAAGPVGVTPDPSKAVMAPSSGKQIRTEYEMGHEFDPEHEKVADSGLFAERSGEAVVDTWRSPDADEENET